MFTKTLIANRGVNACGADVSAKPNCLVCAAHAGEFPTENPHV